MNTRVVVMTLIGLVSELFTYFGVNYRPGFHSYQCRKKEVEYSLLHL